MISCLASDWVTVNNKISQLQMFPCYLEMNNVRTMASKKTVSVNVICGVPRANKEKGLAK